jgi:linoleoyl-CoA desaturase
VNPAGKVAFDGGGEFIRETRREVEEYIAVPGRRQAAVRRLYVKAVVAFGLLAVCWGVLIFAHPGPVLAAAALAGALFGATMSGLCVQHDANHGAFFRSKRSNHLLGWTSDAVLGISSYEWRVKHNVAHHTYTNVDGCDDDVMQTPFAKLAPSQSSRPWYRFQQYYIWPMYTLVGIRWQTAGDLTALVRGRYGDSTLRFPRGWTLVALVGGKAVFFTWAIVIPLLVYPWWVVAVAYLGCTMILGFVMAVTFQLAHCVEEADFASREELVAEKRVWAAHEVETTVNFCPRNPVLTWLVGGLNFQIEHHLFPGVPHTLYPSIAGIVERNCHEHGIRYVTQRSLFVALRSHFRHLRRMGELGLPVELEMG